MYTYSSKWEKTQIGLGTSTNVSHEFVCLNKVKRKQEETWAHRRERETDRERGKKQPESAGRDLGS